MHPTHEAAGVAITPADTLRSAALYQRKHGWAQGSLFDPIADEPFPAACALGAITVAATGQVDYRVLFDTIPACMSAIEVLALHLSGDISYELVQLDLIELVEWISGWNDASERER